ncbi:ice-structuring glycoprotein-like [Rhipicephalus sanguineus]|uniref:ice-structuring glycoprotein-like n=1 Tax=Rhipicephalus sanguineus TaxID=34632 RepID=UPI0020C1E489|nr:ice-structuring glycoprotein-like [Rhipicephalus sanguineus]
MGRQADASGPVDDIPTDPLSTADGSCETHNPDGAARAPTPLPSLGDRDREGHGAAVSGSCFTDNFAECPAAVIDTNRKVDFHLQMSNFTSLPTTGPSLAEIMTASKPQQPASHPPSWPALECLETSGDFHRVPTSALSQPAGDKTLTTTPSLAHNQEPQHPGISPQTLAEGAVARHLPSTVSLKEAAVPIPPEAIVIEDLMVQPMLAADDTSSAQDGLTARGTLRPLGPTIPELDEMKTGKAQRSLQQQEDLPEHQTVSVNGDQPLEKAKVALPPSQVTSEPPATIAAPPKPACNTAAPAAPAAAIAPAVHRVAAKPHQRSRSGTRVVRPPFELRNHLLAQYATALRKKQDEEDYQNFVTWLAQKRATLRAATHAAHANTNTSPAQAPTASLNQLEQQAVTTIGDWLLNKAKEAAPVAADLSEPAATTPVSTDDATSSPYAAMTEDEAIDATATSRKRGREEDAAECPRKQANTQATAGTTTTAAASPAGSPSEPDDTASSTTTHAALLTQAASADSVAAPPAAPAGKRKKNKRKTQSKPLAA